MKMKVSEYFRGGKDLDKTVSAAADDDWGRLDWDKQHAERHGPWEDESISEEADKDLDSGSCSW